MDGVTRRRFLVASGVAGGGALAAGAAGLGLADLMRTGGREPAGADGSGTLVLVTLYGGNDGLNTVIPYADPAYRAARPELAYRPQDVLRLDDTLGLNPVLRGVRRMWDDRRLAIILGVGYPRPDRSHFRSMDIWQTASPAEPVSTGWIGRWLDGTAAPVEAAVSFEPVLPPLLVGRSHIGACVSYRGLSLPSWVDGDLITALGRADPGEPEIRRQAAASYGELVTMGQVLRDSGYLGAPADPATGAEAGSADGGTGTGGGNALAAQLALVRRCIEAGVPTRVYSVSLGGFDTHAQERTGHEALLGQLDEALTSFDAAMTRTPAGRDVTVVVYSEFGRRVRANASDGTDHGTAGPVLVLGPRVVGGRYGEQPNLRDLDVGDLKATTDFRAVFGTVLASVLRADPARYLGGYRGSPLPFLTDH